MHRRDVLRRGFALGAAASLPAFGRGVEGDAFDRAVAGVPWLKPFKGVPETAQDRRCDALALAGRWPAGLRGRFYRNGPAQMERDGQRYHHWFAGDGMVQQFTFGGGARPVVRHIGRMVRTPKFVAEQASGRFLVAAYGTKIDSDVPAQGPDTFNVANTNALEHAGRVLAMWEGGSAFALDPGDLSTQGPVTWQDDLAGLPFSAHPKLDADGHLWNIGASGHRLVVWHVDPRGRLVKAQFGESPYPGGMAHDMAITARHIVVPLPPIRLDFGEDMASGHALVHDVGEPLRILVMRKDDIAQRRVFELPSAMVFHVGNAHERADGSIVLDFVASPSADFVLSGASRLLAGRPANFGTSSTQRAVLDLRTGKARVDAADDFVEFPRVHPLRNGRATRYLVSAATWRDDVPWFHGIQLRDLETGRLARFDHGAGIFVEEHIVVPKPGGRHELDAWLLGTSYDTVRDRTRVQLFDARVVADGPIAEATLPYGLPYGFHGNFTAA